MIRTTTRLIVAAVLTLLGTQVAHARGFGGAHASGGYHGSSYSGGGYHAEGASGHVYHGPGGTTVAHGTAGEEGAAAGPGGAAAGGKAVSGTAVKGPEGNEYAHTTSAERGVAAGPEGVETGRHASSGSAYHDAGGATYARGATGYGTAHAALPTDAGFGMPAAGTHTAAYSGYHRTEAVGGSVATARGAAVRNSYSGYGLYGQGWHAANPGAWTPAGWTAAQAWGTATWPMVGGALGWGAAQPLSYDYGTNVTYQDNQVYYGSRPAATADEYYQQASSLALSAPPPDPQAPDWLPLGVFALVQNDQSEPHYVLQLAVNKAGTLGGNYSDLISGTTLPIQGSVDKKTQRVAWIVGGNKSTVGETGLYNLTQDEAPALIHIGKDKTQQWLLVRLKQPETKEPQ